MIRLWRATGWDERIAIIGATAILIVFISGFSYLLQLAAHLDALDRLAK